jgi:hypothetical protein
MASHLLKKGLVGGMLIAIGGSPSVATASPQFSYALQAQMPTVGNESLSRNLVLRLLERSASGVQILEGRLPLGLPVELPLPDQTQVLGSVVDPKEDFQILLDVGQSPEQVIAFYRERLLAAGWRKPEPGPLPSRFSSPRGFVQTRPENGLHVVEFTTPLVPIEDGDRTRIIRTDVFCKGSFGPLFISARPMPKAPTDVRLQYLSGFNSVCSPNAINEILEAPIPPLTPPSNTTVSLRGGGGSYDDWESRAMLETELDVQALAAHYAAQLQRVGWTQRDNGHSELVTWSNWLLKDKKGQSWQGMLNLVKVEGKTNQYLASVRLFRI